MALSILGGTAEAKGLAAELSSASALEITQLAVPDPSVAADAVLDMRHPFATPAEIGGPVPLLRYLRPAWTPGPGDLWTGLDDATEVARITAPGDVVFVATGRGRLGEMAGLAERTVWWRRRGEVSAPFPFRKGGWLTEAGPFSVDEERALFARLGVDWLIVQNAGGQGARPKLIAARDLGVRVGMIARPPAPADAVGDLDAVRSWIRARLRALDLPVAGV